MPHLSIIERTQIISIYYELKNVSFNDKVKIIIQLALSQHNIKVSRRGVCDLIAKWRRYGSVQDRPRPKRHKLFISDVGILAINKSLLLKPFITCTQLAKLGWKKVKTILYRLIIGLNALFMGRIANFLMKCSTRSF